jgi:hypothetical protein
MDNLNVIGTLRLLTLSDPGVIKLFLEGGGEGEGGTAGWRVIID